jgi:hypothetical protein
LVGPSARRARSRGLAFNHRPLAGHQHHRFSLRGLIK